MNKVNMNRINFGTNESSINRQNIGENMQSDNSYNNLKNTYNDFSKKVNKSDFANSPNRYVVERNFLKQLKEMAAKTGNDFDVLVWNKKFDDINAKLKEFGIEIND